ncbi:MAG: replication-relaxation family protein [Candidatus Saccharimonadales bacterium]|jgi:hypothetical protein
MKLIQIPKITYKQRTILDLLYTHRFLTRIQLQTFLKHKDKKTINLWLKDLRDKEYINWIYNKDHFAEKTKPAIYYLGINGIRHMQNMDFHPSEEIHKRYREHERSQTFIDRCLLLADVCLELDNERNGTYYTTTCYYYETEADYHSEMRYHFMSESELIRPDLCIAQSEDDTDDSIGDPDTTVASYLLEIFDPTLPRYRLRNKLKKYVQYLEEELDEWDEQTGEDPRPTILLVCATLTDLIYAKRRTKGLMAEIWEYDDEDRPHVRFTTAEKLRKNGLLAEEIWEKA